MNVHKIKSSIREYSIPILDVPSPSNEERFKMEKRFARRFVVRKNDGFTTYKKSNIR